MRISRDLAKRFGAKVVVLHVVPKGIGDRALEREQAAVTAFVREHAGTRRGTGIIREATSVRQAIIKEAANHDLVVMGASAQPTNAGAGRSLPVRDARRVRRVEGAADRDRGEDATGARHGHLRAAAGQRGHARACRCARRDDSLAAGRGRPLVRREHVPRARVLGHPQARRAQGTAGPHDQRRPACAQRGEDDRHRHQAREGRADGPRAAHRPDGRHRLRQRGPDRRDRHRARSCPSSATRRSSRRPGRTAERARRCGRASTCSTATSSPGSTPTSATSSRASCTGCSGRSCASRASPT